jgi:hypothetical protein
MTSVRALNMKKKKSLLACTKRKIKREDIIVLSLILIRVHREIRDKPRNSYAVALLLSIASCCVCATKAPIPKNTAENTTSEMMPLRKNGMALV